MRVLGRGMKCLARALFCGVLALSSWQNALAQDGGAGTSPHPSYGATALAQRLPASASERTLKEADFRGRPRLRMLDLLSTVPGLYVVQHAGGGKANQYFLRGFDAD